MELLVSKAYLWLLFPLVSFVAITILPNSLTIPSRPIQSQPWSVSWLPSPCVKHSHLKTWHISHSACVIVRSYVNSRPLHTSRGSRSVRRSCCSSLYLWLHVAQCLEQNWNTRHVLCSIEFLLFTAISWLPSHTLHLGSVRRPLKMPPHEPNMCFLLVYWLIDQDPAGYRDSERDSGSHLESTVVRP